MRLALLFLALLPLWAQAESRTCWVVGVGDGDTLSARCGEAGQYEQIKVRIAAIDAPEKRQPFGNRARQALASLCFQRDAEIYRRSTDRYKRIVADVECQGQDVAAFMVGQGMAWVYDRYAKGYAPLYKVQARAREGRVGLWADREPVAPWEWRKVGRKEPVSPP